MIFVGDDWGEARHDVTILDEQGRQVNRLSITDTVEGARRLQDVLAEHTDDPEE